MALSPADITHIRRIVADVCDADAHTKRGPFMRQSAYTVATLQAAHRLIVGDEEKAAR